MNKKIAPAFINGLTQNQLEEFIEKLFFTLSSEKIIEVFNHLSDPEEIIKLYQKITNPSDTGKEVSAPSTEDKFIEEWKNLVFALNSIINDIGDEDGEYAEQYEHWNPQEFDAYQAASDMDKIFQKMLPLLKKAHILNIEKEIFFIELLDEIKNNIKMYPDWMGAEYSEFEFDSNGAECFLLWNWLFRNSMEDFVKKNVETFKNRMLPDKFSPSFLKDESSESLKELYAVHSDQKEEKIEKAFSNWKKCCKELDMQNKLLLVDIQSQFYNTPDEWDEIKSKMLSAKNQPWFMSIIDQWKRYVIFRSLDYYSHSTPSESWIGWLIDYVLDDNRDAFKSKTETWLKSELEDLDGLRHGADFSLLFQLTRDVLGGDKILDDYPTFKRYINSTRQTIFTSQKKETLNDKFRLACLKNFGTLKDAILPAWCNNIHKFITSPEHVEKADYRSQAKWLAIAKELNSETFKRVHADWKAKYWRKRNLWRDLKSYGIEK